MVSYEWQVELIDEHGDIVDMNAYDSYRHALDNRPDLTPYDEVEISLVRRSVDSFNENRDEGYAIVDSGKLPDQFDSGHKIPDKYRNQLKG